MEKMLQEKKKIGFKEIWPGILQAVLLFDHIRHTILTAVRLSRLPSSVK